MRIYVNDYSEFLNSIYNYIIETYGLIPRTFEGIKTINGNAFDNDASSASSSGGTLTPIEYTSLGEFNDYDCVYKNKNLHVHDTDTIFCTEPEIIAARYVNRSIFGKDKHKILKTLKLWLPTVTEYNVGVDFVAKHLKADTNNVIYSDLYPSYANHFLRQNKTNYSTLKYYFISNIDLEKGEYSDNHYNVEENEKIIMVRARSRSRSSSRGRSPSKSRRKSRSPSPKRGKNNNNKQRGGGRGRRRRRRSKSNKSRSPSPNNRASSPTQQNNRKRSRSRSRVRSSY